MTAHVLIPGAGGSPEYWTRVVPLLEQAGHTALAVDLPGPDPTAGLPEYADLVIAAAQELSEVVLVAHATTSTRRDSKPTPEERATLSSARPARSRRGRAGPGC